MLSLASPARPLLVTFQLGCSAGAASLRGSRVIMLTSVSLRNMRFINVVGLCMSLEKIAVVESDFFLQTTVVSAV